MMHKRFWALVLALLMVLSLAACGAKQDDDDDDDDKEDRVPIEDILRHDGRRKTVDPDTLSEEALRFLSLFGWYETENKHAFDASHIEMNSNLLDYTFTHAVNFNAYPGPEAEQFVQGDPRGQFSMCNIYDAEKTDWILQNIFHYTQHDITALRDAADESELSYYYEDGSYYIESGGVGGGYEIFPCHVETDGERWYVTYASYFGDGMFSFCGMQYAELSEDTIDGERYWTLHKWSETVPEAEHAPSDRLASDCAGSWILDSDGVSEVTISDVADGHFKLQAGFYRLVGFTADAVLQSDGATAVFTDAEGGEFSGWVELGADQLVVHVFCCPDYIDDSPFYDYFHDNSPFTFSRSGADSEPSAEPEGADPQAWIGTWKADDGEFIVVSEATGDHVTLNYSTFDANGGSMHHTDYTLAYTDETKTQIAEDESVIAQSGYRLIFTLSDGGITLSSRYPDKDFIKQ